MGRKGRRRIGRGWRRWERRRREGGSERKERIRI